jgi:hypothetical protein
VRPLTKHAASFLSKNKLFACLFIMTVLVACLSYAFAPVEFSNPQLVSIVVPGKGTFDLAAYPFLDRRVIGLVNLFRDYYKAEDLSNASVNDLSVLPPMMTQYFLAFTTYGLAKIAESTPSYRTGYYKGLFNKLIAMMNSSAMEQVE